MHGWLGALSAAHKSADRNAGSLLLTFSCMPCALCAVEGGQVAIFDATNTTKERRQQLVSRTVTAAAAAAADCLRALL
jgi:predicted kinase